MTVHGYILRIRRDTHDYGAQNPPSTMKRHGTSRRAMTSTQLHHGTH